MLVWVSKRCIPGGDNLDDDLSGWHIIRLHMGSVKDIEHFPCMWDGRNNQLLIYMIGGLRIFNITERSTEKQEMTWDKKWYLFETKE